MGGFMGWFLVFAAVLAIFNAEKLPALRQMMEEKMKGSVEAAKESVKMANDKIKKVKTDIENKKSASPVEVEAEENTPEEIEESLQFMGNYIKKEEQQPEKTVEKVEETNSEPIPQEPEKPAEDGPIDLENRY